MAIRPSTSCCPGPTAHDPVNQVISTEELHSLVACLSSVLSDLESSVLSLYLDGHSYEAIGERLDCDTKTVDNALQRVKRKVGSHLDRGRCCSSGEEAGGRTRTRAPALQERCSDQLSYSGAWLHRRV